MKAPLYALIAAVALCGGCTKRYSELPPLGRVTLISVSGADGNHSIRRIANPQLVSTIVAFVDARREGWGTPWFGVPVGVLTAEFYDGSDFRGSFQVGGDFFATQREGMFLSLTAPRSDTQAFVNLLASDSESSSPETLVMPRELVDFAHFSGCTPINDFFERPGMINPPFLYGAVDSLPGSAAFWCKKAEKSDRPYNLMFAVRGQNGLTLAAPKQLEGCPAVVEYWNGPAGLSIQTRRNLELRYFQQVDMPKKAAPSIIVSKARTIVSDNGDGLVSTFYCYQGRWLVNAQH